MKKLLCVLALVLCVSSVMLAQAPCRCGWVEWTRVYNPLHSFRAERWEARFEFATELECRKQVKIDKDNADVVWSALTADEKDEILLKIGRPDYVCFSSDFDPRPKESR